MQLSDLRAKPCDRRFRFPSLSARARARAREPPPFACGWHLEYFRTAVAGRAATARQPSTARPRRDRRCDRLDAGLPTHPSAEPCDRRFRFGSRARAPVST